MSEIEQLEAEIDRLVSRVRWLENRGHELAVMMRDDGRQNRVTISDLRASIMFEFGVKP